MKKKKDYRESLAPFNVSTRMGLERFLIYVGNLYHSMYPSRAAFFKRALANLRQVTVNGGQTTDFKGRTLYLRYRVPTELMLFIQRWVPEFGQDDADIQLLCRVWKDLVVPAKDRRKHTLLYKERNWNGCEDGSGVHEGTAVDGGAGDSQPLSDDHSEEGGGEGAGEAH